MRFSILGPLLAEADDGARLGLCRPSQRATLAVLLLHAAKPASKNLLIDALWGDQAPRDADTALRVRMREVRRVLAGHDRVQTHPAGYQIVVQPGELDADDFLTFTKRGRKALDGGNAEEAARLLSQACALWRDPPLADVPDTPVAQGPATALAEQLRAAREWLMDARLALGQHHEMLSQIRAGLAADPMSEHPHVQLMLALYRCGQKVAALDAYSRLRELTTREFGQDPGPEANEMLRRILDDSPDLRFQPRALTGGAGGRPVWTPLRQLPAPPPDFTGRTLAIEALVGRMPDPGMTVTVLTGPPGAGKTALALRVAHLAADAFPDGQLFVSLGGRRCARQPLELLGELLRSLGVPAASVPAGLAECAAMYRSMLAGRRVLVLADDATAAAQLRPLLPGSSGAAVLVTATGRLGDLEGARHVEVDRLSPDEALALLGRIAGPSRLAADRPAAEAIVSACAGLPLALRIAGAELAAGPGHPRGRPGGGAYRRAWPAAGRCAARGALHRRPLGRPSPGRGVVFAPAGRAARAVAARARAAGQLPGLAGRCRRRGLAGHRRRARRLVPDPSRSGHRPVQSRSARGQVRARAAGAAALRRPQLAVVRRVRAALAGATGLAEGGRRGLARPFDMSALSCALTAR